MTTVDGKSFLDFFMELIFCFFENNNKRPFRGAL